MKNAHLITHICFLQLRTGKLTKVDILYIHFSTMGYSLFTSLPVDVQYIHFLQAEAYLEVYIPIYTMANGQSDH